MVLDPLSKTKYSSQTIDNAGFDDTYMISRRALYHYNPATDSFEPTKETDAAYVQYDTDDSAPNYIGVNANADALDGDTDWTVYKFTYSGSNVTSIKRKTGSWTGRVALFS